MVALAMIAKEAPEKVLRAVESCLIFIDEVFVVLEPGDYSLFHHFATIQQHWREFDDYSSQRNHSLGLAREKHFWSVVLDADDYFEVDSPWPQLNPDIDAYEIEVVYGDCRWWRKVILNPHWEYRGKVHELPHYTGPRKEPKIERLKNVRYIVEAVSDRPGKYDKYLELLEDDHTARGQFYRAYAYRDKGDLEQARVEFYKCALNPDASLDEQYLSFLWCGALWKNPTLAIISYHRATLVRPDRAEGWYWLARAAMYIKDWHSALACAEIAAEKPIPDGMFIQTSCYGDTGLVDALRERVEASRKASDAPQATIVAPGKRMTGPGRV